MINNCQVVIIYLDDCGIPKERILSQSVSAKDAIIWGDLIRRWQKIPGMDIGFTTGIKQAGGQDD